MRNPVRDFQGWAHCIIWDEELNKAVGIVMSGNGSHSNQYPFYRVTIDSNGYMSEYEEVTFNYPESDNTEVGYIGSILILKDGSYWCCDYRQRIFKSYDKGYTWEFLTQLQLGGRSSYNNDFLFGVTKLSNGRLVAGNGGDSVAESYYSDDEGISWNVVPMNILNLGNRVYPEGVYKPFEPFFIDCGNGKVIQYARASMNAYKSYSDGIWTQKEAAVYSKSEDYGTTWTPWEWSKSLEDMTANNGKICIIKNMVHCVYGSRWINYTDHYGNKPSFVLRYIKSDLNRVFSDDWDAPEVIDVGHWDKDTAIRVSDCGYPSIWSDKSENLYAVYYDSDESELPYGANWRLIMGNPYIQPQKINNSGKGSKVTSYSQAVIDSLLSLIKTQINDLYMKVGEMPPNTGDNEGTYPVMEGLVEWFEVGDVSQWNESIIKSKISSEKTGQGQNGNSCTGLYFNSKAAPTEFNGNMSKIGIVFNSTLADYGITTEFSIEFIFDVSVNQSIFALLQSPVTWNGNQNVIKVYNNNIGGYQLAATHVIFVFTQDEITTYRNGTKISTNTESPIKEFSSLIISIRAWGGGCGGIRLYNHALSANEIQNNYKYAAKLTEMGTSYF